MITNSTILKNTRTQSMQALFAVLYFLSVYNIYGQSLESVSRLTKNMEQMMPSAIHASTLAVAYWGIPSSLYNKNTSENTVSAGAQAAVTATVGLPYAFRYTTAIGDVLSRESLFGITAWNMRVKQWKAPYDVGLYTGSFAYSAGPFSVKTLHIVSDFRHMYNFAIAKQKFILLLGAMYGYSFVNFTYATDSEFSFSGIDKENSDVRIKIEAPVLDFTMHVHSISTRAQINTMVFPVAFLAGLGVSLGLAPTTVQLHSDVLISRDRGNTYTRHSSLFDEARSFFEAKNLWYQETHITMDTSLYIGVGFFVNHVIIDFQAAFDFNNAFEKENYHFIPTMSYVFGIRAVY